MSEFGLIEQIRTLSTARSTGVFAGIGDDAAILEVPEGHQLVVCTDTLNEGVHFFADADATDVGFKALAVNLSDLAAMGAQPAWLTLNLSLPWEDAGWVGGFMDGFDQLARQHGVQLVGGDTTRGPLSITVTALGLVRRGTAIMRSGAKVGDVVVVSGQLGDAARALQLHSRGQVVPATLAKALARPEPRIGLGQALVGRAHCAIDLSDGLISDLGHMLNPAGCGARIYLDALPASGELLRLAEDERWALQLTGGDDYELCFTLPDKDTIREIEQLVGARLTVIGEITNQQGIQCLDHQCREWVAPSGGFDHFSAET